jgi:circadian clock protein KaiC
VAVFEERPEAYAERATSLGLDLETPQKDGKLTILYLRPLDLSVDETMQSILDAVQKIGAKRLVIDSLAGFEMALSPGFRADFRESLYRMIFALTGIGVTILSTVEVDESFTEFPFSTYSISFLTDDIIRLRYVSIDGQLRKIMVVIKMRGGNHAKDIREYEITSKGVVILGKRLTNYQGLISGIPRYWTIRYLVANTGNWLTGRKVLISPYSLNEISPTAEEISVQLTKARLKPALP